jgi:hypothetical protein
MYKLHSIPRFLRNVNTTLSVHKTKILQDVTKSLSYTLRNTYKPPPDRGPNLPVEPSVRQEPFRGHRGWPLMLLYSYKALCGPIVSLRQNRPLGSQINNTYLKLLVRHVSLMSHITWRSHLVYIDVLCSYVKGTVPRYFPPPAFFIKRLLLVPIDKPRNVFNFLNIHRVIWLFRCFTSVNDTSKVNGIIVVGWPLYYLYPEYLMHTF